MSRKRKVSSSPRPVRLKALEVHRLEARKILGDVAERTFAKLEADGVLVPARRGRGGRPSVYSLETIVPAYLVYVTAQRPSSDRDARSRKDISQAELNELRLKTQKGELLPRDQVILEGQHYTKAWSAKVRALPRQLVQAGIVMRDQEPAVAAICRDLLSEIASWRTGADLTRAALAAVS
jgi:hypothetical protein